MGIFSKWRNPEGYSDEEMKRWHERLDNMPELLESYRLMREIIAGNSSMLTTIVTQLTHTGNRMDRQEIATRSLIDEVVSLSAKVEKLTDLATVLVLERENTDGTT